MTNPPTPAEMPKPDFIGQEKGEPSEYEAYYIIDGESDIQRFATEQVARAQKAETENERLREALCFLNIDHLRLLARYFDHHYPDDPQTQVQDDLRAWADKIAAALHPTTEGDEDE